MPTETQKHNRGVLPAEYASELISLDIAESTQSEIQPLELPEHALDGQALAASNDENHYYRRPRTSKSGTFFVMSMSAVCGAIGGVIISQNSTITAAVAQTLSLSFGEVFTSRVLIGVILLAVEFVLGFFAFGDLLVWTVPLVSGLCLALRIASERTWSLLPSALVTLGVTAFAAAVSAGFSQMLMSISRGGTVHLGNSPRRVYVLNFLGYFVAIIACALYEGIILNVNR